MQQERKPKTTTGVIAAVIHELLKAESFSSIADLKEAIKCRCATLRIPYDATAVYEALDLVERTRETVPSRLPRGNPQHIERQDGPTPVSRAEAAAILQRLGVRVPSMRSVPPPPETDEDFEAARQRAYEMGIDLTIDVDAALAGHTKPGA